MNIKWILWLDDVRLPSGIDKFRETNMPSNIHEVNWARNVKEAKELIEIYGTPYFMYLDHDLGTYEDTPVFLKWLVDKVDQPPDYFIISSNPIGQQQIKSFMESWKRIKG